jgi:RNA recognition motif-containing protein
LEKVKIPKDRDGRQRSFGFVTFRHECSVPYSVALFEGTHLFNKILVLQSKNATNSDVPQREVDLNNAYTSERQRTQSVPINFGSTSAGPAVPDYNMLFHLGQQMLIPGSLGSVQFQLNHHSNFTPSNSSSVYRSQMNSSYYLGGNLEKVSKTSYNRGHNRNHPYAHGGGSRGYEDSHRCNSDSSNLHDHHRDRERRTSGRRRRY